MLNRLRNFKYLRSSIILSVDVVMSFVATIAACFFVSSLFHSFESRQLLIATFVCSYVVSIITFWGFKLHRDVIRHFSAVNVAKILVLVLIKALSLIAVGCVVMGELKRLPFFVGLADFLFTAVALIGIRCVMVVLYYFLVDWAKNEICFSFIYSTRGTNPAIVDQINKDVNSKYRIKGFLTHTKDRIGTQISGVKVFGAEQSSEELLAIFKSYRVQCLIFTSHDQIDLEREGLVEFCIANKIQMLVAGGIESVESDGAVASHREIKPIQIEDLLERKEIDVEIGKISAEIEGKIVMVTGAAGSIGSEIASQVASFGAKQLIVFDAAETPMHNLQLDLTKRFPQCDIKYILGDVRSKSRVESIIDRFKPVVIFHAAAYKHVPMVEGNPCEGVLTNVWGTVNMARCAMQNGVEKFVMISTDKAVNPTNVMGATKRIAEMCVQMMNRENKTEFITTRFGNVLGSNGSVIPLFKEQIAAGGPVTVTHPDIIRYFMTIPEACRLVLQAATMGHAGEILVFDMGEQVRIADLAKKMIRLSGFEPDRDIKIEYTGLRPGEKLYEELLSSEESTEATNHKKIRIAQSVVSNMEQFDSAIRHLIITARSGARLDTVREMKSIAPEFKSRNSIYEELDV